MEGPNIAAMFQAKPEREGSNSEVFGSTTPVRFRQEVPMPN